MKKVTWIFVFFLLFILLLFIVQGADIYIRWTNTTGSFVELPHSLLNIGGTIDAYTTSYASSLDYKDNGEWWCKSGRYNVSVCVQPHDSSSTISASYPAGSDQDASFVCKTILAYNYQPPTPLVWDSTVVSEQLGDFYKNGNKVNDVDSGTLPLQYGSCCGDDDYNATVLRTNYNTPYRWCVRPTTNPCGTDTSPCQTPNSQYVSAYYDGSTYYPGFEIYYKTPYVYETGEPYTVCTGGEVIDGNKVCACNFTQVNRTYLDDPDMGSVACYNCMLRYESGNPVTRMWDSNAPIGYGCCGDDVPVTQDSNYNDNDDDNYYAFDIAGSPQTQRMCLLLKESWYWKRSNAPNIAGITFKPDYGSYQVLVANGSSGPKSEFLICDGNRFNDTFGRTYIHYAVFLNDPLDRYALGYHDYICYNNEIYECCGNDPCHSNNDTIDPHAVTGGNERKTGAPVGDQFCSSSGMWVSGKDYDKVKEVCEDFNPTYHYDYSGASGPCCGDDHNAYYQPAPNDTDTDGSISDCLNFSNGNLCIQQGGTEKDVRPNTPKDCYSNGCTLDNYLDGSCCKCPAPNQNWPCHCTPIYCAQGEVGCDPRYAKGWTCTADSQTFPTYSPYVMDIEDVQESKRGTWEWKAPTTWPGYIYYVSCAKYSVVSEVPSGGPNLWLSCTNFTISNKEIGFRLHDYPYTAGDPNYIPTMDSASSDHKAQYYVSNPQDIAGMNISGGKLSTQKHGYLCYVDGRTYNIRECCDPFETNNAARGFCNSAKPFTAGLGDSKEYFTSTTDGSKGDPATYYCKSDYTWSTNLDNITGGETGGITCKKVHDDDPAIGWTGSYCCGDDDDYPEYYNDPLGKDAQGACWNSTFQENNTNVRYPQSPYGNIYQNIFVINGTFHGCLISDATLLSIKNCAATKNPLCSGQPLILNHPNGATLTDAKIFCNGVTGIWEPSGGLVYHDSSIQDPYNAGYRPENRPDYPGWWTMTGACPGTECWIGFKCIKEYKVQDPPLSPTNYRCVSGEWVQANIKYTWDRKEYGYCVGKDQCLVAPDGISNDPNFYAYVTLQRDDPLYDIYGGHDKWWDASKTYRKAPLCVEHDTYIGDNYCENGSWSSRTKFVATQLLDYVTKYYNSQEAINAFGSGYKNYTLFCDNYWRATNKYDYLAFNGNPVSDYLKPRCKNPDGTNTPIQCVNKFCILKYNDAGTGDQIVFGVTLNVPLNTPTSDIPPHLNFLEVLGIDLNVYPDFCTNAIGTNIFTPCTGVGSPYYVYYNDKYMSVIFSNHDIGMTGMPRDTWFSSFVTFIRNPVQGLITYLRGRTIMYPSGAGAIPLSFISNTTRFDRLFIDVKPSGKKIIGVNEKVRYYNLSRYDNNVYDEYIALNYSGFSANICNAINEFSKYNQNKGYYYESFAGIGDHNEINCSIQGNSYYVISRRPTGISADNGNEVLPSGEGYKWIGDDLWDDLTEQLRAK